jgi:hypothetical protein
MACPDAREHRWHCSESMAWRVLSECPVASDNAFQPTNLTNFLGGKQKLSIRRPNRLVVLLPAPAIVQQLPQYAEVSRAGVVNRPFCGTNTRPSSPSAGEASRSVRFCQSDLKSGRPESVARVGSAGSPDQPPGMVWPGS